MALIKPLVVCILLTVASTFAHELPERDDSQPLQWWQEEVVYQIYPRSHKDSDGDGTGDLRGIVEKLDHFVDLDVGSVWISPIYKSPMKDMGYDISDFRDIDPSFGTMADFESMSQAMKDRGIKLIMDFVPNHSSDEHEWFVKSIAKEEPYTDYYVWSDPKFDEDGNRSPPNNWLSVFGGPAWEWNEERGQYYLHQFLKEQPDLDYRNEAVVQEILDVFRFWLEKGVDGFRVDAVPHIFEDLSLADESPNPEAPDNAVCDPLLVDHICLIHDKTYNLPETFPLLAQFRRLLDIYSLKDGIERVLMVESTVPTLDELFKYYGSEESPIAHYPFNFEFINRIQKDFNGDHVSSLVNEWFTKMPEGNTANWLLGNHDNHRVATRLSTDRVDALNMINLLLPGSAVTYYGEEIGMTDADIAWEDGRDQCGDKDRYKELSRDFERTPMHWNADTNAGFSTADKTWLPVAHNYVTVNVENQGASEELTHLKVYKRIVELRKTDAWRYGSMQSLSIDDGDLFGFTRIHKGKGFVFLANFGSNLKIANLQQEFNNIPDEAYVHLTSVGYSPNIELDLPRRTDSIAIRPNHAIIFQWIYTPAEPTEPPKDGSTTEEGNTDTTTTTTTTPPPTDTTPEEGNSDPTTTTTSTTTSTSTTIPPPTDTTSEEGNSDPTTTTTSTTTPPTTTTTTTTPPSTPTTQASATSNVVGTLCLVSSLLITAFVRQ